MSRRIVIDPITRLEGHGRIELLLDERGDVASARLQVPELRGFERFCVGRPVEELPRLTSHVCGVCPAAHHLASVRALDALYGAEPPPAARLAQALYYNLFVFEDHLLHYWYMGGPDLLVGPDAPAPMRNVLGVIARVGASLGGRIMAARREARELMAGLAGRAGNPVFAVPGGISRAVPPALVERARTAAPGLVAFAEESLATFRQAVLESPRWMETIESEPFRLRLPSMGMVDGEGRLAFLDGDLRIVDAAGRPFASFAPREWLDHLAERVEPWSYAKFTFLKARGWSGFEEGEGGALFRVGPLARLNVATAMATPRAEAERQRLLDRLGWPAHQTLAFHWARLVEALQAAEAAAAIAAEPGLLAPDVRRPPGPLAAPAEGVGAVEAPRGTLIHHYAADAAGMATRVNLAVASQHNGAPVQVSIAKAARALVRGGRVDGAALNHLEMAFRAYDPCSACASHALPGELPLVVTVRDARGEVVDVVTRGDTERGT